MDSGRRTSTAPTSRPTWASDGVELLDRVATVVKSPGVPREAPVVAAALERGMEVTGELELAWRLLPNPFVAVTGTNGKTTTVELLGAIWRAAGLPVAVAGNVGTAARPRWWARSTAAATVVCECSSFQLEDASAFAPECAVLLNVEPDHLDRHGNLERYRAAKMQIFAHHAAEHVVMPRATCDARTRSISGDVRPARGAQPPERARGGAGRRRDGGAARGASSARCERVRGRAAPPRGGGRGRRRALRQRLEGHQRRRRRSGASRRSTGGVHVILGGSLKGGGFEALRDAGRRSAARPPT